MSRRVSTISLSRPMFTNSALLSVPVVVESAVGVVVTLDDTGNCAKRGYRGNTGWYA